MHINHRLMYAIIIRVALCIDQHPQSSRLPWDSKNWLPVLPALSLHLKYYKYSCMTKKNCRVGQRYCCDVRRIAVTQLGNMAKARLSHFVTGKADVGVSFGKQRMCTLKGPDPELRPAIVCLCPPALVFESSSSSFVCVSSLCPSTLHSQIWVFTRAFSFVFPCVVTLLICCCFCP